MPKVSILTAVKAKDALDVQWLGKAIKSVQAQSEKDWEMIIVNDHSDVPLDAIKPLFDADKRLKGAVASDMGVSQARNQAANMATAELLLPLDHDDWLAEDAVSEFLRVWRQEGHKHGIVYSDTVLVTKDAQKHFRSPAYDFEVLLNQLMMPVGCLHRKADWARSGGWKSQMDFGLEDWEYWITMGELGACGYHLTLPLYFYRRHARGRLAALRKNPTAYDRALQQIRSLHQDTYNGRKPVGCCGGTGMGGKVIASGMGAPALHGQKADFAELKQMEQAGTGLVAIMYVGRSQGFYVKGRPTGFRYAVDRPNSLVMSPNGQSGVHPDDVKFITSLDRGTSFRRV